MRFLAVVLIGLVMVLPVSFAAVLDLQKAGGGSPTEVADPAQSRPVLPRSTVNQGTSQNPAILRSGDTGQGTVSNGDPANQQDDTDGYFKIALSVNPQDILNITLQVTSSTPQPAQDGSMVPLAVVNLIDPYGFPVSQIFAYLEGGTSSVEIACLTGGDHLLIVYALCYNFVAQQSVDQTVSIGYTLTAATRAGSGPSDNDNNLQDATALLDPSPNIPAVVEVSSTLDPEMDYHDFYVITRELQAGDTVTATLTPTGTHDLWMLHYGDWGQGEDLKLVGLDDASISYTLDTGGYIFLRVYCYVDSPNYQLRVTYTYTPNYAPTVQNARAQPSTVENDGKMVVILADVADQNGPDDIVKVEVDTSPILSSGGWTPMGDDGNQQDGAANDGTFGLVTKCQGRDPGTVLLPIKATDRNGEIGWGNASVTILKANEPPLPTGEAKTRYDVLEDKVLVIDVAAMFEDPEGDDLTYGYQYAGQNLTIALDPHAGSCTVTPKPNWHGEEGVVFLANDSRVDGMWGATIRVLSVNDPPVLNLTEGDLWRATEDAPFERVVSGYDPVENDPVQFSLLFTEEEAWFSIDASSGRIAFTPDNDRVGDHRVTVVVRDPAGAEAAVNVTLRVANTNDPPEFAISDAHLARQGQIFSLRLAVKDPDPDERFDFRCSDDRYDVSNGWLNLTPTNADVGVLRLTITVTDSGGASDTIELSITVQNVNDPPLKPTILSPSEGAELSGEIEFKGQGSDPDGDTLDFIWTSDRDGDLGSGETLKLGLSKGLHVVTLTVRDPAGASNQTSITIEVGGGGGGGSGGGSSGGGSSGGSGGTGPDLGGQTDIMLGEIGGVSVLYIVIAMAAVVFALFGTFFALVVRQRRRKARERAKRRSDAAKAKEARGSEDATAPAPNAPQGWQALSTPAPAYEEPYPIEQAAYAPDPGKAMWIYPAADVPPPPQDEGVYGDPAQGGSWGAQSGAWGGEQGPWAAPVEAPPAAPAGPAGFCPVCASDMVWSNGVPTCPACGFVQE